MNACIVAYGNGEYSTSLQMLKLLFCLSNMRAYIFKLIGNCYLKLNNYLVAADYFEVAQELSKKENSENKERKLYDYQDSITVLRNGCSNQSELEGISRK